MPALSAALLLATAPIPAGARVPALEAIVPVARLPLDPAALSDAPDDAPPAGQDQGIVVSGKKVATPGDPVEALNAQSFAVVQKADDLFVAPAAHVYTSVLPEPVRDGLHNALLNLDQPVIVVNSLLQFKMGRAAKGLARLAINSTIGLGGLFDVAKSKKIGLPYKHNGFANTFGFYGIRTGPYFYLPLVGPTTLRDVIGLTMDRTALSLVVGGHLRTPAYAIGVPVVRSLDFRVDQDRTLTTLRKNKVDSYAATRNYYLAQRQWEIDELHGSKRPEPQPEEFVPKDPSAADAAAAPDARPKD